MNKTYAVDYRKLTITLVVFIFIQILVCSRDYAIKTIINVAFEPNCPPYQFVENGNPMGLHIDIMEKIAEINNYEIKYFPIKGSSKCLAALDEGEVDIVLGFINSKDSEYKSRFSDMISQSSICMIAHKDDVRRIQEKLIFESNNSVHEYNTIDYDSYFSFYDDYRFNYTVVNNQKDVLKMLLSESADVAIGVKDSLLYQLQDLDLIDEYVIIANYLSPVEYTMVLKDGDSELMSQLSTTLRMIRSDGQYERIHNNWIQDPLYEKERIELTTRYIKRFLVALIIIAFILLINLRISRLLKKKVALKTKELQITNEELEEEIKKSRKLNELRNCVMENSPTAIVVFNNDFRITLFNKNAYIISGKNMPEIGMSILDIDLFNVILKDKMEDIFVKGEIYINNEMIFITEDRERIEYKYDIYRLFDSIGAVRGALISIADVTVENEIKRQYYEREKNKTLNQLIAGIAHEIRNPLMSIKTFVELIPNKWEDGDFRTKFVNFVPIEVERVNKLIKNLIDYAKPAKGYKEDLSLEDIFNHLITLLKPMLQNEYIQFSTSIEDKLFIHADRNQIIQILINIILNGYESMKDKIDSSNSIASDLALHVKAYKNDRFVFIEIEDKGLGMTEEEIVKSTDPFYTNKANGTGLGLSITEQFVRENNGVMQIESIKNTSTKVILRFWRELNE